MRLALLTLALIACEQRSEITSAIKQTVAETRTKPQVIVVLQLDDDEVRKTIERRIEEQHIGTIKSEAAGVGHLDFIVEVDSTVDAIPRIREVVRKAGVLQKTTIRIQ